MRESIGMRWHVNLRVCVGLLATAAISAGSNPDLAEPLRLHAAKRYEDSLKALTVACRAGAWNAKAYKLKGLNLGALGRGPEAEQALEQAVDLASQDADAWYLLGFARFRTFRYQEAVAALTTALKLNADLADAWMTLALAHEWLQQPDDAERAYRALLLRPRVPDADKALARLALGKLLVYHQNYGESIEQLSSALRSLPDSTDTMKYLARAYRGVGRHADALPVLRKAAQRSPGDPEIRYLLLRTCQALDREAEAQEQLAALEALADTGTKP